MLYIIKLYLGALEEHTVLLSTKPPPLCLSQTFYYENLHEKQSVSLIFTIIVIFFTFDLK